MIVTFGVLRASARAVQPTSYALTFDELEALSETDLGAPPLKGTIPDGISDHAFTTVDIPFAEPTLSALG
jgi:hypothetical protein